MSRERILVAGGAGFIGSALVRRLLSEPEGPEVLTLDLLTYAGLRENLEGLPNAPRHAFVQADVADERAVGAAFAGFSPTAVVNLAAETHVDRSHLEPARFARTNVVGAQVLLDAAHRAGVRMLHVSTDEVFGSVPAPRRARAEDPLLPTSPYAASKAGSDLLVGAAFRTRGQDVVLARCTNNYGPRQSVEKLIPHAIWRARSGEPVPLYGDGLQERDWIHVEDHVEGLVAALRRGKAGEVHHFAGGRSRPNRDVVRAVLRALGAPESLVRHVEDRPAHDRRYALDDDLTRRSLGWAPRIPFEEGLAGTVRWYLENAAWCAASAGPEMRRFFERNYGARRGAAAVPDSDLR